MLRPPWYSEGGADNQRTVQQPSCSQPHPISITPDFSAFSQYSPQYLLPSSGRQSHAGWAHLLDSFSAIELLLARLLIGWLHRKTAKRDRQDVRACGAQ